MFNTSLFRACAFLAVCGSVSSVSAQETGAATAAPVAQQPSAKADSDVVVTTPSRLSRTYGGPNRRWAPRKARPRAFIPNWAG